jgi:hypothetical protein
MRSLFPLLRFALAFSIKMLHVSPSDTSWGIVMQNSQQKKEALPLLPHRRHGVGYG